MKNDWMAAKALLLDGGYTCVLCGNGQTHCHRERGVLPLLAHVRAGEKLNGFVAADRVVGKAAAFLYVLLEIEELYVGILSRPAADVLRRYGIAVHCDTLTDMIRNRAGDGYCPMEQAVWQIEQPEQAREAIEARLAELNAAKADENRKEIKKK